MREYIKKLARQGADNFGARYLPGWGVRKMRRLLPRPVMYSLNTTAWDNVLVLAPHPDDEVFGAGLLLDRLHRQGARVTIAFATCGEAFNAGAGGDRKEEAESSARRLGAKAEFLGFKDGQLRNAPGLDEKIADLCARIQPQAIVLPWFGDYHDDHRALARAALRRPQTKARYLFYGTFSPLWPGEEFKLSFLMGGEEKVRAALEGYPSSVNGETINGFMVLRRALARTYINNDVFWEPYLVIPGSEVAGIRELAADWPQTYPALKKARHWRSFLRELKDLHKQRMQ